MIYHNFGILTREYLTIVMLKQISELIFYQQGKAIFKFSFTVKNNRHIDKKNI